MIEVSKYGTTAFPIIFTAVVAGLMKTLALWRCEKGIKLGVSSNLFKFKFKFKFIFKMKVFADQSSH